MNPQYKNFYLIINRLELCTKDELKIIKDYIEEELKTFNQKL